MYQIAQCIRPAVGARLDDLICGGRAALERADHVLQAVIEVKGVHVSENDEVFADVRLDQIGDVLGLKPALLAIACSLGAGAAAAKGQLAVNGDERLRVIENDGDGNGPAPLLWKPRI